MTGFLATLFLVEALDGDADAVFLDTLFLVSVFPLTGFFWIFLEVVAFLVGFLVTFFATRALAIAKILSH